MGAAGKAAAGTRRRFLGEEAMSDTTSNTEQLLPPDGAEKRQTAGSSSARRTAADLSADQPTIVTSRVPIPCPAACDSADRILEGRVMPGDRIGHFELVEYVGGGGMGRVFRAIDTRLNRTVALKILPPEQAAERDASQRFQNEAQSAARLDHENIARVYYVGEDRDLSYIVSEFIEGENVRSLVERNGPLPLADAISYTLQIAEALAHADSRTVVHRDIKPSNVLVTPEGRVKLIDMGLARMRQADPAAADLTASGVTLGTFDYISPEQARDPRHADVRSDIYSLGCTLFYMLSGQPPFPEGTVLQKLLQHQGDQPPDIRQFRPELPDESRQVLEKMMAKDPNQPLRHARRIGVGLVDAGRPDWAAADESHEPDLAHSACRRRRSRFSAGICPGWCRWPRCSAWLCCWIGSGRGPTVLRPRRLKWRERTRVEAAAPNALPVAAAAPTQKQPAKRFVPRYLGDQDANFLAERMEALRPGFHVG